MTTEEAITPDVEAPTTRCGGHTAAKGLLLWTLQAGPTTVAEYVQSVREILKEGYAAGLGANEAFVALAARLHDTRTCSAATPEEQYVMLTKGSRGTPGRPGAR